MTSTYDAPTDWLTLAEARQALDELMAWVGVDALVAALRTPGLLAEIDRHAAAVRDVITQVGRRVDAFALCRYARSIVAAARQSGHPLPEPSLDGTDTDWSQAGWHLVRLAAVCALADEVGCL